MQDEMTKRQKSITDNLASLALRQRQEDLIRWLAVRPKAVSPAKKPPAHRKAPALLADNLVIAKPTGSGPCTR